MVLSDAWTHHTIWYSHCSVDGGFKSFATWCHVNVKVKLSLRIPWRHMGTGDTDPLILNPSTRWEWVVSYIIWSPYLLIALEGGWAPKPGWIFWRRDKYPVSSRNQTTHPTWTCLELYCGLHGESPTTNCLSHNSALGENGQDFFKTQRNCPWELRSPVITELLNFVFCSVCVV
jgi:hypothetical protein